MKKIDLKKIEYSELSIYQNQLEQYASWLKDRLTAENLYDSIICMDISLQIWYSFRTKIENPRAVYNLKLKPSEAAVLTKCAIWDNPNRNAYENNAMLKCVMVLDQKMKSLNN